MSVGKYGKAFLRRKYLRECYREVFSGEAGEAVLHDLSSECCLLKPSYVQGDSHHTSFSEGSRYVILRILKMMNADEKRLAEIERKRDERSSSGDITVG